MAQRYSLSNGLTVVFEEQHAARAAAFQVWVKAGSADERPDQAGLAHLHEHMLFKGTAHRGPGQIAHDVEAHGGEINAWTSFDQTVYHIVIASQFARMGLDILGDALRHSSFDAGELAREIEVVCEEIKRGQDTPSRRASRDLFATAYQTHPYRHPVIGTAESVRGFGREHMLEFYQRHYTPRNVVLVATGDFTEAELRGWVEEIFGGDWGRPFEGPVRRPLEPEHPYRRVLLRTEDVKEAHLNLAFPIPEASHPDVPALDALASCIGQGDASRLLRELKRKRGLVNDIHTSSYTPRDPGLFTTTLLLPADKLPQALEETARILASLRTVPPPADELATVQAIIDAEAVYQRETVQGLARKLGHYQANMGGVEEEAHYQAAIARLTPEHLREVAERYLRFDRAIVTALLPPGTSFSEAQVQEILDRVASERPSLPDAPRAPRPAPVAAPRPVSSRASSAPAGHVVEERLPSGARILVREERAVPLFALRAVFPGGLRYETAHTNGLTTLVGRGLTQGTPTRDAEEISRLTDDFAGMLSGQGGRNTVGLRGEFLSRYFTPAFHLFADCLLHPRFPEAEVARDRALLLQNILTREDKPAGLAMDLFGQTLFTSHPYRLPSQGEQASVERLEAQALRDYHAAYMDPSQLTLSVVGDVHVDEVLALAHEAFGRSRGQARPPPTIAPEPPPQAPRTSKRELARAQSHLVLGFHGLRMEDPRRHALDVLTTVLSGQGGRLFLELRDKRSLAYSVASFTMEGVDPGYLAVYMGTSPEKVDEALAGIREQLSRVCEELIPEDELSRSRQNIIGTHEISLQRNNARAALLALDACYGLGLENFLHYAERVAAVTAEDVRRVARDLIHLERAALAIVGP